MGPAKKVGIACKEGNKDALGLAIELVPRLEKAGIKVLLEDHISQYMGLNSTENLWSNSDLLVVAGGDGTLLRAVHKSIAKEIPILGVHMGRLGFLAEVTPEEIYTVIGSVLKGDYLKDERTTFDAEIIRDGVSISKDTVLNDVVINKSALARIIEIEVWVDTTFITRYRGDGLILSTPTGSTAYNLAADGPIVHPDVAAIILTPICPHILSNRTIILPDSDVVSVVVDTSGKSDDIFITLDGQRGYPLKPGDRIRIKKAAHRAVLVRSPGRDYFKVLRTKLNWQET